MAPLYKLIYFPTKAVGESIRFLLKYGEVPFEDKRIPLENWFDYRDKTPFGQLPILEVNGKTAYQSTAICRYLAKKFKLVGKDDWEDLEIDAIVDTISDLRSKLALYHYERNEEMKEARADLLFEEQIPFYLERLDAIAKANNGHLAVKKLTWADILFAANVDYFNTMAGKNIFENYPNLQKVESNVKLIPAIKKWIEERPHSEI